MSGAGDLSAFIAVPQAPTPPLVETGGSVLPRRNRDVAVEVIHHRGRYERNLVADKGDWI